jgi:hypothetical protein
VARMLILERCSRQSSRQPSVIQFRAEAAGNRTYWRERCSLTCPSRRLVGERLHRDRRASMGSISPASNSPHGRQVGQAEGTSTLLRRQRPRVSCFV